MTSTPGPASNAAAPGAATRPTCTETCEPDQPHLITHVATTDAATADLDTVPGRHADLAAWDLLPCVHLVDAGYVSVGQILSGDEAAFDLTRFTIDDARHVVCPNGKTSRN